MFDRLFSTIKVNYQDDFERVKRIARNDRTIKLLKNCCANNGDFVHGDELPLYVEREEVETEEEADETDDDH